MISELPDEQGDWLAELRRLIERVVQRRRGLQVTLVAHSMGGQLAHLLLRGVDAAWKSRHIAKLVTIGTPWAGGLSGMFQA